MHSVTVESGFSAAHNLRNYKGKCEKLHGHNYRIRLTVEGRALDKSGMLVDFVEMKSILKKILSKYDHGYLNEITPFDKTNPTAENIAEHIYKEVKTRTAGLNVRPRSVAVWETEKNCAEYYER